MGCGKYGREIVYDGVRYKSIRCLCRVLEVNTCTLYTAKSNKHFESIQEALDFILKKVQDHEGRYFRSVGAMCKYHGVNYDTFMARKSRNMSLEECLYPGNYLESRYKNSTSTSKLDKGINKSH